MNWQDLLADEDESVVAPWVGGRTVYANDRTFRIKGRRPTEFGWYSFKITGPREVKVTEAAEPEMGWEEGYPSSVGYLIGDRLIPDDVGYKIDPEDIYRYGTKIHIVEPGLEMFSRVKIVNYENRFYVYASEEFPLGPESQVIEAYDERKDTISEIPEVVPSLDLSFRYEVYRRADVEHRRAELERLRLEEEAARVEEERRANVMRQVGTGAGRRELARVDFGAACRASLSQSGAEYLGHTVTRNPNETAVRYRFRDHRLECVVDHRTLRIVDAGICLSSGGVRGDTFFTLESLPAVVGQAIDEGLLHIYRYA